MSSLEMYKVHLPNRFTREFVQKHSINSWQQRRLRRGEAEDRHMSEVNLIPIPIVIIHNHVHCFSLVTSLRLTWV